MSTVANVFAYITIAILVLLVPMAFSYLIVLEVLFSRLRRMHPDHYEAIGRPSVFLNNSISKSRRMSAYLKDRDYLVVPDSRVVRLGNLSRGLLVSGLTLFGLCILAFAVVAVSLR
jgi:hypothetical protein